MIIIVTATVIINFMSKMRYTNITFSKYSYPITFRTGVFISQSLSKKFLRIVHKVFDSLARRAAELFGELNK
jgi:hypothetical protein